MLLGVTPGLRGILYHRLFSREEPGFVSEPAEVQLALSTVSQAIKPLRKGKHMTWILDSGVDDIAVGRTIWEDQDHVVCRVYHTDRRVEFQDRAGQWQQGDIAQACAHLRPVAREETSLEVQRGKQAHPKKQPVVAELAACPLRLTYWSNVRRPLGKGKQVTKRVWLVQVQILGTHWEPWLRLPDWPVEHEQQAVRIFAMYRPRWAVELALLLLKEHLQLSQLWSAKWEVVQVQIWCALLLAQVFHGLQAQLAAQEGVDPFDVSIDLLVEVVPRLLQRGIAPLPFLGRVGRELGLIRPNTRLEVQVPFVDATWITPAPPGALQPRDTVCYAQRNCARGPRPPTKKAG